MRSALEAGERSGPAKPLDFDAFVARKRKSAR
ncbi:putative addiction module antidote protein, CopG/Arc/MetJ family [Burkholderia sp. SJ98]|nr:putative addiction module antidote protein, CopG/Arc/MetJ family [Burkholderia sp. SJ98]